MLVNADGDNIPTDPELYKLEYASNESNSKSKYTKLSLPLHNALPSREDTEKICKAARHPSVLAYEVLTIPYDTLDKSGLKRPESLLEIPGADVHPVLVARHMLRLAIFLQHLHPDIHKDIRGLSESPSRMQKRLADLAISLVTSDDDLLGSMEGLECLMLESMYQVNIGNLRRSWVTGRRAMCTAQLMGLNRSDSRTHFKVLEPKVKYHPQFMWFRILFLDRHLSLMLGLPQGSCDRSMASDTLLSGDTPTGRLERIHCVIASRILERNESKLGVQELSLTRNLDNELQKAARCLPSKWWLVPALETSSTDSQALFWDMQRMFAQVLHYNLLNQLHLPYLLRSSSAERKYEYSRMTCVNASREVLTRFIALRSFNRIAYSCRIIDFLTLMAALTLLLAHLESHRSEENPLAHQFYSDRAMIEQAQDNMQEINDLNSDALSAQTADLLQQLLSIQVEMIDGSSRHAERVSVQEAGTEALPQIQDEDIAVSVDIPYFGTITIAREGIAKKNIKKFVLKDTKKAQADIPPGPGALTDPPLFSITGSGRVVASGISTANSIVQTASRHMVAKTAITTRPTTNSHAKSVGQLRCPPIQHQGAGSDVDTDIMSQFQYGSPDPLLYNGEYPSLTAGGEDWAFQGVDLAFFESLMRSSACEDHLEDSSEEMR
jgi:hypothetical protein